MDNATSHELANSTNATGGSPTTLTEVELWIQFIVFYLIINGVGSAACHAVVFSVILIERKKLSTRFFVILASLALTRTILGVQLIFTTCYRILRTLGHAAVVQPRMSCYAIHFALYFGNTLELVLLIAIVVDRVMAIAISDRYRHLTPKHAVKMCFGIFISVTTFKLILAYATDFSVPDHVACTNMYSPTGAYFNAYTQNIDFALILCLLLIYLWLIIDLRRRTRKAGTSEELKAALKRRTRVMPAIRNLVLLHCAFTLTAKAVGVFSTVFVFKAQADRIIAYQGMMICCDNLISGLALVVSNKDLRIIMKRVLLCQNKQVGDWGITANAGSVGMGTTVRRGTTCPM